MKFRALQADEIDVRVGGAYKTGVTFLLYKNARVDMAILDETVGEAHWQRDHKEVKGNLFCGIGIRSCIVDERIQMGDEWIWKWDCGTESNTEKEKGEASDSFKRAGFNWGIGRELYTAPLIWLPCATDEFKDKNGYTRYKVHDPKEINGIYVSTFETAEINGKRFITKLELSQHDQRKENVIFRWEKM